VTVVEAGGGRAGGRKSWWWKLVVEAGGGGRGAGAQRPLRQVSEEAADAGLGSKVMQVWEAIKGVA
jgi:hypothetical protein